MTGAAAALTRINLALAANDSADAVAWLEEDFDRKYEAWQYGGWSPSHCVRPMLEVLADEYEEAVAQPADLLEVAINVDGVRQFIEAAQAAVLTVQQLADAFGLMSKAFHPAAAPDPVDLGAMHAAYDRRRRARRRRNR